MAAELPKLIVNADDFGYTGGVNRAIDELHRAGALSSASMMATGSALEDALALVDPAAAPDGERFTQLGIGCHIVLVDGAPVLSTEEIPTLTQRNSPSAGTLPRFRPTLNSFVADLLQGRIREREIEREAVAQIRLLQAHGVSVTHLDTHKHAHMFPRVLRPLLRAALQCGIKAIRNPFEPVWSRRATPKSLLIRRAQVKLLSLLQPEFARLVKQAGLHTTAGSVGILATGTLDTPSLERLLRAALHESANHGGSAVWELVCHPGYHDAALAAQSTRLLAARERERAALIEALPLLGRFRLTHFGGLSA